MTPASGRASWCGSSCRWPAGSPPCTASASRTSTSSRTTSSWAGTAATRSPTWASRPTWRRSAAARRTGPTSPRATAGTSRRRCSEVTCQTCRRQTSSRSGWSATSSPPTRSRSPATARSGTGFGRGTSRSTRSPRSRSRSSCSSAAWCTQHPPNAHLARKSPCIRWSRRTTSCKHSTKRCGSAHLKQSEIASLRTRIGTR
mmetsp:Transcript_52892/g.148992  ORF Transcript_52892/g.148992 Transcript_52892/m.148992 type:complete len:201 (+) Transcript_52892:1527-2129(+)